MNARTLICGKCRKDLPFVLPAACPECGSPIEAELFPARTRATPPLLPAENVITDEEASCFFHSDKKAAVPCDSCGRFLCRLCDCELHGQHYCPDCLNATNNTGGRRVQNIEKRRMLWDRLALAMAVYPMLIFYFTLVTAPAVIFVCIRFWNAPGSILPRTKARFIIALILAVLQILGWIALTIGLISLFTR